MRLSMGEISVILQDAEPAAVFFGAGERQIVSKLVDGTIIRSFVVGVPQQASEVAFSELLACEPEPITVPAEHDDCVISYTSGTTGTPKGVITTQANYIVSNGFLNAIHWGLTESDRILVTTPLAHRTAFARVGNVIVLGCTLFILPRFEAEETAQTIEREQITLLGIVPTVGRMMLTTIEENPARFASLRILVATGEAFPLDVKRRLQSAIPHLRIYSFFAMTEAGALAILRPEDQFEHGASVGRVTPGAEIRLVDAEGHDAAVGEPGEIWARSGVPGQYLIFRAYFKQEQATQEAFEGGWFKTGDIGRFDDSGFLHIVDRKKDMVLSGGYNIYSKEVELALRGHEAVADAAVVGVPDDVFGEAVAAFIEREPGAEITAEELIRWCGGELASYKKPKYVIFLPELPRNNTGKVTKNDLRKSFQQR
jgi:long-chain acyl-CoA synthetase